MQWIAAAEEIETFMQIWYKVYDAYAIFVTKHVVVNENYVIVIISWFKYVYFVVIYFSSEYIPQYI